MKTHRLALVALAGLLVACDADQDGLSDAQEKKLGTDPDLADSDGDGLSDFDEVEVYGTSATSVDSDDDSYPDNFEIERGSDPNDDTSWAYVGGWPYNPTADALEENNTRTGRQAEVGKFWPRMTAVDQFGDQVDLYHFAQQGVPVILDIGAEWCPPCNVMSEWVSGGYAPGEHPYEYDTRFPNFLDNINEGKVIFVTVVGQDDAGALPRKRAARQWDEAYPNEHVPVLADTDGEIVDFAALTAWPTMLRLNDTMRIRDEGIEETLEFIDAL